MQDFTVHRTLRLRTIARVDSFIRSGSKKRVLRKTVEVINKRNTNNNIGFKCIIDIESMEIMRLYYYTLAIQLILISFWQSLRRDFVWKSLKRPVSELSRSNIQ